MKLSTLLIINAVIAALFAFAFLLVPGQAYSLYGVEASATLKYTGRLLDAALIGFTFLKCSARNASDSTARKAIVLALIIGSGVGFVVALIGQLNDVVSALGWSTFAIYLLFALGFGYFQFAKPASAGSPSFGD